jgi:hypothetical protein
MPQAGSANPKTVTWTDANGVVWDSYTTGRTSSRTVNPVYKQQMYDKGYLINTAGVLVDRPGYAAGKLIVTPTTPSANPAAPASSPVAAGPAPQPATPAPTAPAPVDKAYNAALSSAPRGRGTTRAQGATDLLFGNMGSEGAGAAATSDSWGAYVSQAKRRRAGLAGFGDMIGNLFGF